MLFWQVELEGSGEGFTSRPVMIAACGEIDGAGREIEEVRRLDDEAEMTPAASEEEAEEEARLRMAAMAVGGGREGGEEGELTLESNLEGID